MKNYPVFGSFSAEGSGSVTVDTELSSVSENPVQNKAIAAAITNPNLLINPDFKINQRGKTEYNVVGYTVDGWFNLNNLGKTAIYTNYISTSSTNKSGLQFRQYIEKPSRLAGKKITFSFRAKSSGAINHIGISYYDAGAVFYNIAKITAIGSEWEEYSMTAHIPETVTDDYRLFVNFMPTIDNHIDIEWAKLEIGSVATPFTPPDPATELAKCQRYYQIRTTGDIDPIDLRPSMRITPTVTMLDDGNYAYNAEL